MITHRATESVYCITNGAANGLSRLTKLTTSKGTGTADSIRKFSNRPIPFESNRIESNLEASQVPSFQNCIYGNAAYRMASSRSRVPHKRRVPDTGQVSM